MKKRLKVIFAAFALVLAACAFAAGVGRMEYVAADLSKRTATVAWTWTDMTDHAVRLSLTRNGEDFPTAGWGGTLFVGDGALGCAVAGTASGYCDLFFDVGRENVPTNGRYVVQVVATNAAGRVEEWARGTLTVRANPSAEGMPTNWTVYADLARKVAPYIDVQGILSGANYTAVSNAAMCAAAKTEPITADDGVWRFEGIAEGAMTASCLFADDGLYVIGFDKKRKRWRSNEFYGMNLEYFAYLSDLTPSAIAATNYTDWAISTNNAAFVEAVLAAPLTGADQSDVAEIAEYGSYTTVGAAILALIAGLAALKRKKQDLYSFESLYLENGLLTVSPYTAGGYTPTAQDASITIAVGALPNGVSGKLRDCLLKIDCTLLSTSPQLEFGATGQTFVPFNGDGDNVVAEAGAKNVFYISEYEAGAFFVARQTV